MDIGIIIQRRRCNALVNLVVLTKIVVALKFNETGGTL